MGNLRSVGAGTVTLSLTKAVTVRMFSIIVVRVGYVQGSDRNGYLRAVIYWMGFGGATDGFRMSKRY